MCKQIMYTMPLVGAAGGPKPSKCSPPLVRGVAATYGCLELPRREAEVRR